MKQWKAMASQHALAVGSALQTLQRLASWAKIHVSSLPTVQIERKLLPSPLFTQALEQEAPRRPPKHVRSTGSPWQPGPANCSTQISSRGTFSAPIHWPCTPSMHDVVVHVKAGVCWQIFATTLPVQSFFSNSALQFHEESGPGSGNSVPGTQESWVDEVPNTLHVSSHESYMSERQRLRDGVPSQLLDVA